MQPSIEQLKAELAEDIKSLATELADSKTFVGLLSNEMKFNAIHEKFMVLKFLERKKLQLHIFDEPLSNVSDEEGDSFEPEVIAEKPVVQTQVETPQETIEEKESVQTLQQSVPKINLDFNDKMGFTMQLFGGNSDALEEVLSEINATQTPQTCYALLNSLAEKLGWNQDDEYAQRLQELAMKRFD